MNEAFVPWVGGVKIIEGTFLPESKKQSVSLGGVPKLLVFWVPESIYPQFVDAGFLNATPSDNMMPTFGKDNFTRARISIILNEDGFTHSVWEGISFDVGYFAVM